MPIPTKATPGGGLTVDELREWFKKNAEALGRIDLTSLNRTETRSYATITVDNLKQWFKSPYANAARIQKAAQYFFRTNTQFRKIVFHYVNMFMPNMRSVVPRYNLSKQTSGSDQKIIKGYYATLSELEKISLDSEIKKMLIGAWVEDVSFGVLYEDDSNAFILPLESDYCKLFSTLYDGSYSFAYDMTYFRNRQDLLEIWGEPFVSMYREYEANTQVKWVQMPPECSIVIKVNTNDPLLPTPPLAGLLIPLLFLDNLQDIQNTKDELSVYKILVAQLETLTGTNLPDDFQVDPDTAVKYFNKFTSNLPETVGAALTPLPLSVLNVMEDDTSNTNRINDSQGNIYNTAGVPFLCSKNITSSTAWKIICIYETNYGLGTVLPQIQAFVNRWLLNTVGGNCAKVVFHKVSPYTAQEFIEGVRESCTLGIPNRLLLANCNGVGELDTLRMNRLEVDVLNLNDAFIPMSTSYTQSSEVGAPTKKDTEITDDGIDSREKRDRTQ